MRKVQYPENISEFRKFKKQYLGIFPLHEMQRSWRELRTGNELLKNHFPKHIRKILLADYELLVKYYIIFTKPKFSDEADALKRNLKDIFDYDKYQSDISEFFRVRADDMNLHVCHYCETAYINSVTIDGDEDGLERLNKAKRNKDKLKNLLKLRSSATLDAIMALPPIESLDEFERYGKTQGFWENDDKIRKIFPKVRSLNHFDLDHVLDKGACPIVALSVMNFVPSCQICNQKLKKSKVLGDRRKIIPKEHLSPTSPRFDFDGNVTIALLPLPSETAPLPDPAYAVEEKDRYQLHMMVADHDYDDFIGVFHLEERYAFHKLEGLRWIQLKERYPDSAIHMMADTLGPELSFEKVKEDIFGYEYDKKRHSCFAKFKKDCLK